MSIEAFKLLRQRKDGTLGPLFINARQRIPLGEWLLAEDHPTKGFAHRPGWHCTTTPEAPHLSMKGRVWCRVQLGGTVTEHQRPESQGGMWLLAGYLFVTEILS